MTDHTRLLPDEYVRPRYPVDEPPTYRERCACGWTGPERYKGVNAGDHREHSVIVGYRALVEAVLWNTDSVSIGADRYREVAGAVATALEQGAPDA